MIIAYSLLHQPRGHNKARIRKPSGRRARSTDRPIDRSIRFNTSLRAWSSTGSNVAYRLLRQPRGHIKARIRKPSRRRARSPDRAIDQSIDRPIDSIQFITLGPVLNRLQCSLQASLGSTTKRGLGTPAVTANQRCCALANVPHPVAT